MAKPKARPEAEPEEAPVLIKEEGKAHLEDESKEAVVTRKINKYGFLHVDRKLAQHLGLEFGKEREDVPVTIEVVEGGFVVKLKT